MRSSMTPPPTPYPPHPTHTQTHPTPHPHPNTHTQAHPFTTPPHPNPTPPFSWDVLSQLAVRSYADAVFQEESPVNSVRASHLPCAPASMQERRGHEMTRPV